MRKSILILMACALLVQISAIGQSRLGDGSKIDYSNPKKYTIGGIKVEGTEKLDPDAIKLLSGLRVGDVLEVPGPRFSQAIRNIWDQGLFADVKITYENIVGNQIFLAIHVKEQPRLSRFKFNGLKKSEAEDIREEINLYKEKIVTENLIVSTQRKIRDFFVDKGYLNVNSYVKQIPDSNFPNHVLMIINVQKGKRVRIDKIEIEGNQALTNGAVRRALKETKQKLIFKPFEDFDGMIVDASKAGFNTADSLTAIGVIGDYFEERVKLNVFKSSKYIQSNFDGDKANLITKYNSRGYRDARIVSDTLIPVGLNAVRLKLTIDEGNRYYYRNIRWYGNSIYSTDLLSKMLGIRKGDVYDSDKLNKRLMMDPNGGDISSLYMDDGYLFFQINPNEVRIEGDSIDIDIRIYEGQQAEINRISVTGNTKTNEHVVMREIRTRPGNLFSRTDIIRSQRQLSVLGYFDPEQLDLNTIPNPSEGNVDIEYIVAEKPSDQVELSGGWGAGQLVGNLGLTFSNFSTKNFFKRDYWQPLPSGDGQRLSLRASSNGRWFQSYNMSFTEPWLGGRKPLSFSVSVYHSVQTNGQSKWTKESPTSSTNLRDSLGNRIPNPGRADIKITGGSLGLAQQLKWPDDYFIGRVELAYQNYVMNNWTQFLLTNGNANNIFARFTLSRNSQDQEIFPRMGSNVKLSLQFTPPYSLFNNKDYSTLSLNDRYKWVEYYKWKFSSEWFTRIYENLVLRAKAGFGFLGLYNQQVGQSPFERFYLGGSGLTGFQLDAREIIALRGYDDQSVSARTGGTIISKYTLEMRYPFSLNPSATVFGLAFLEAGNTWNSFRDYNPFEVKRSGGIGVRVFLPMFGLLGLDYGWRFDDTPEFGQQSQKGQLHFTIGAVLGEL